MAVWDVGPPRAVASATMRAMSSAAVSDGVRSSATRITGPSGIVPRRAVSSSGARRARTRRPTSRKSAARAASSGLLTAAMRSAVRFTASRQAQAGPWPSTINWQARVTRSASARNSAWALKIPLLRRRGGDRFRRRARRVAVSSRRSPRRGDCRPRQEAEGRRARSFQPDGQRERDRRQDRGKRRCREWTASARRGPAGRGRVGGGIRGRLGGVRLLLRGKADNHRLHRRQRLAGAVALGGDDDAVAVAQTEAEQGDEIARIGRLVAAADA